jgi:hypothetical protein
MASSLGLVVKVYGSQQRGGEFKSGHPILNGFKQC